MVMVCVGNGHVSVFPSLALEYEHHLALKADVLPSALADLADSKRTVIYESKQCLVIQGTVAQEPCDLFLGEYPWKLLWLAYLGQYKSARLLEPHNLVVSLQSEDRMLEEREAVALLVQDSREIVVDVCLCELFRQLFEKQHRLCNLQAVVIDTAVRILCETQLFSEKRNAVPEFGYSRNRLVQCSIRHGVFG